MIVHEIRQHLSELADSKYCVFQSSLIPTAGSSEFIGVRTPELRAYAKDLAKRNDIGEFLNDLPHKYFDENQLHAFIISLDKDYDNCVENVEMFLPYVDNWASCDQMSPKVFKKHRKELLEHIDRWLKSDKTYTVRFGIKMLMDHFLNEDFDMKYPCAVANIHSQEYYVKMMQAWYFATALAKQYDSVIGFIKDKKLDDWTHNKTIQKAVESYRISDVQKQYLKKLKVKGKVKDQ